MKYRTMFAAACLSAALLMAPAYAEDAKHNGGMCEHKKCMCAHHKKELTLEQARERAKEKLDKLNAMTPAQWEEKKKHRHEHCEKCCKHGEHKGHGDAPAEKPAEKK